VGYVVEFYCAELRLVIEVDGAVHAQQHDEDRAREADLRRAGARILRSPTTPSSITWSAFFSSWLNPARA
jgi:very-short-patch-repair endonuclease